jgi:hypothetical protein
MPSKLDTFDSGNPIVSPSQKDILAYAVSQAIKNMGGYYSTPESSKIINDDTFEYIWKNFPDKQSVLLEQILSCATASSGSYYKMNLSAEFSMKWISKLYWFLSEEDTEQEDAWDFLSTKLRIQPFVDAGYDYLEALTGAELRGNDKCAETLKAHGLLNSKDSNFYDFCFSKVKRQVGGVDIKYNIVSSAAENEALSEGLIRKIAKSAPISLKRQVTRLLSGKINNLKYSLRYEQNKGLEADITKNVDYFESLIILFASVPDRELLESVAEAISTDNLPWILPAVSQVNNRWLTERVERLMQNAQ